MRRRIFLQVVAGSAAGAAGAVSIGMPALSAASPVRPEFDALAHPQILQRIGTHRLVREIGDAYRASYVRENNADLLANAILAELPNALHTSDASGVSDDTETSSTGTHVVGRGIASRRPAELHAVLERQIRLDFAHGRTVRVCGWILSRTEARQCALYSILYA